MPRLERYCSTCEETKNIRDFYYSPIYNSYQTLCKECDKKRKKEWYTKNKKEIDMKRKEWQRDNYELHLEHQRKYNNSEKGMAARERHREKLKEERRIKREKKEEIEKNKNINIKKVGGNKNKSSKKTSKDNN